MPLSVVIPNGRALPVTLMEQLRLQLHHVDDEILVVRNQPTTRGRRWFSHRGSRSQAAAVSSGEDGIVRLLTSGPGAAAARNAGWQTARNEWILFLDDDVMLDQQFLHRTRSLAAESNAAVNTFRIRACPAKAVSPMLDLDRGSANRSSSEHIRLNDAWRLGAGAAMLVHLSVLSTTGGFKERLGAGRHDGGAEDLEFLWHLSRHGTVRYCGDISVDHPCPVGTEQQVRKLVTYARSVGRLAGASRRTEGVWTLAGFCRHALCAAALAESRPSTWGQIYLGWGRALAVAHCIGAFGRGWLRPRDDILCQACLDR